MKYLFVILMFFNLGFLNAPAPFSDTSPDLQHYVRELYDNLSPLLMENTSFVTTQTTDATITDVKTIHINENEAYWIDAKIIGYVSNGDRAFYHLEGLFYRNSGGNVTQQGSTTTLTSIESNASWNAALNADTTNQTIDVRVTGASAVIIWRAVVRYKKIK